MVKDLEDLRLRMVTLGHILMIVEGDHPLYLHKVGTLIVVDIAHTDVEGCLGYEKWFWEQQKRESTRDILFIDFIGHNLYTGHYSSFNI